MSSDWFDPDDIDNGDHDDGDLIAHLRAFGATLADQVDEPIRPTATGTAGVLAPAAEPVELGPDAGPADIGPADVGPAPIEPAGAETVEVMAPIEPASDGSTDVEPSELAVPLTMAASRTNRGFWLAAAALVFVAAGFGLGRLWPDGDGAIDSTGSPDAESTVTESDSDSDGDGDVDGSDEEGQSPPDADQTDPETTPVAPAGPSTIVAADGTVLSVIGDQDAWALEPSEVVLDQPGDVVARAVLLDLVRQQVFGQASRAEVAERLLSGGLTITTTFDPAAADLAADTIAELYPAGDRPDEVAVLTIDNRTGAIVATASSGRPTSVLVDGLRQPGSAFKSIVVAALFEQGYLPSDRVSADGPCEFVGVDGNSSTFGGRFGGVQSIQAVTRSSNNCAFVRLGQAAGLDQVVDMGQELGLTTLPEGAADLLSLPLGVTEVNGVELAGAYATFANGGVHRDPWLVTEVVDGDGAVLLARDPAATAGTPVLSEDGATLVTAVLESNVIQGTGYNAQLTDHPSAGKTGTTEAFTDAWFVGYTSQYTTVVWVGDPEGLTPIELPGWSSFGGALPATIWGHYNEALHRGLEPEPFPEGPDLLGGGGRLLEAEFEVDAG